MRPIQVTFDADLYDEVFASAVRVLRSMGFEVNRQDYRYGVIDTDPLDSPSVFEPWRPMNSTLGQVMQSTFTHVRRQVTIKLAKGEGARGEGRGGGDEGRNLKSQIANLRFQSSNFESRAGVYVLKVEVVMEVEEAPTRRLIDASRGERFSTLDAVPVQWAQRGIEAQYWTPIGRDEHLAKKLTERIMRLAGGR